MSRYDNMICPVCKKPFKKGDDIVVCPECGTPHHRACYDYVGHCVNRGLHNTGFNFNNSQQAAKQAQPLPANEQNPQPQVFPQYPQQEQNMPPQQNIPNRQYPQNQYPPQQNQNNNQQIPFPGAPYSESFENDPQTIDGESMADVAATVRNNVPRFTEVFKKLERSKSKVSWNWGAFFFGSLYYFYRKIYRQAISLMCIAMIILFGSNLALTRLAPKTTEIITAAAQYASQNNAEEANKVLEDMTSASDYKTAMNVAYVCMGLFLILRIIEALFADSIYKKYVTSLIKRVRVQLDNGATFSMPLSNEDLDLSQTQMRRYYLSSKGGVNLLSPILALFIAELIISLL